MTLLPFSQHRYRQLFDAPKNAPSSTTLLHFGAVDWNSTVYLNGVLLGNHVGGYDGFTFALPSGLLKPTANELYVLYPATSLYSVVYFGCVYIYILVIYTHVLRSMHICVGE